MTYAKRRIVGIVLLLLSIALLLTGTFGKLADQANTPLAGAYADANANKKILTNAQKSITDVQDALTRAEKRVKEAVSNAEDCVEAAQDALEAEQSGIYDIDTEAGLLGQSIVDVQNTGADMTAVIENLAPVVNAELVKLLTDTQTLVSRAESAVEDAAEALQDVVNDVLVLDAAAEFAAIPEVVEITVPKLGDLAGVTRLMTRANNYTLRSETAQSNLAAISEASTAIIEAAQATVAGHPTSLKDQLVTLAHDRYIDLLVIGGILFMVGIVLSCFPGWLAARWKVGLFRKGFIFVAVLLLLTAALYYATGETWELMRQGVIDTLYMTIPATFFAYLLGLPLGVLLVITAPGHIRPNPTLNNVVGTVVNFLRSIPFIILLVMLFDVTRFVMGTAIGTQAIIFPLFVSAFPYVARIVEGSLNEVDSGVIEAAESMGSTTWQIIRKVLIPESLPSLINGAAICMTTILAYTAMAGSAGGDGLGKIAITYGLNYREYDIMYISSLLLVALVQIIQIAGSILMRAVDHRRK